MDVIKTKFEVQKKLNNKLWGKRNSNKLNKLKDRKSIARAFLSEVKTIPQLGRALQKRKKSIRKNRKERKRKKRFPLRLN